LLAQTGDFMGERRASRVGGNFFRLTAASGANLLGFDLDRSSGEVLLNPA
jgi:hypothetical protein